MKKQPWRDLFTDDEPQKTIGLFDHLEQLISHTEALCSLLMAYWNDHRVSVHPWPFGESTTFNQSEFGEALDLHRFLEQLHTRAVHGLPVKQTKDELMQLFEAFKCADPYNLNKLQYPGDRQRRAQLNDARSPTRQRVLPKDKQVVLTRYIEICKTDRRRNARKILAEEYGTTWQAIYNLTKQQN